ncbi:hypothetical protein C8A01DRAFT_41864 [Parachaetomium inaequale]|uniref:Uncharacterized protein n=1 Tax=Parachaetomium inaequale TaxID=2588326 RepID=A0AAN6P8G3_9PEZI|nr:hypothetical protein C8A01DRAFT_41864 [Parachaetomium inaequale]
MPVDNFQIDPQLFVAGHESLLDNPPLETPPTKEARPDKRRQHGPSESKMKKVKLEDSPDDANQQTGTSTSAECKDDSDDEYVECKKESGEDSEEYDDDWSASEDGTRRSDHKTSATRNPHHIRTAALDPKDAANNSTADGRVGRRSPRTLDNAKRDPRYNEHIDAVLLEARHLQRLSMLIHLTQAEKKDIVDFVLTGLDDSMKEYARELAYIRYKQNNSRWKNASLKNAKDTVRALQVDNEIFARLEGYVDIYRFFAERWDKTGMKEFSHVMTWVDGYIDIANSTPNAKQWCRNIYVQLMGFCKLQLNVIEQFNGNPPGIHEYDDAKLRRVWDTMTDSEDWGAKPSHSDFKSTMVKTTAKSLRPDDKFATKLFQPSMLTAANGGGKAEVHGDDERSK